MFAGDIKDGATRKRPAQACGPSRDSNSRPEHLESNALPFGYPGSLGVLRFFNTNPEHYSVIFTSGCTGALKLVAESFSFSKEHPPLEKTAKSNRQSTAPDDAKTDDNSQQASKGGNPDGETTRGDNQTAPDKSGEQDGGKRSKGSNFVLLEPERSPRSRSGYFCYLQDNHTSVQGMRELAAQRCSAVLCLTEEELMNGHTADTIVTGTVDQTSPTGNCLLAYPGQSNFSGRKYPLTWIEASQNGGLGFQKKLAGRWFVVLDAASLVSTSPLDLSRFQPDFVTLSFYKIFGFPTGLGALLVRNTSSWVLERRYFGGGTVAASTARDSFCALRPNLSERFEDGTLPYLDIIALRHGFDTIQNLAGGMDKASSHSFLIAQYFAENLGRLHHGNGTVLAEIYASRDFRDRESQGAIVNFSLRRSNGDYIGFAEVDKLAQLHEIHLRTGCFCNIGACQLFLGISSDTIRDNLNAGHVCGDDKDLINGRPTGSVRISFGYMSSLSDAVRCLQFIAECFLETHKTATKPTFTAPEWYVPPAVDAVTNKETSAVFGRSEFHGHGTKAAEEKRADDLGEKRAVRDEEGREGGSKGSEREEGETRTTDVTCSEKHRKLTDIFLYPIKSCGAFRVNEWEIGDRGLLYDRTWMVVSENGIALDEESLVQRFRANLVIDGGLPFDEDNWTGVTCGDVQLTGEEN
nr:hypothetical protein BaRGS_011788 [Batillaria attramentaria]